MTKFPIINNINDVLPHIAGIEEIFVSDKNENYDVINYTHPGKAFDGNPENNISVAMRRECRGLIFDKSGKLISRPFHKFFNVNEREETLVGNIDWSRPHTVMHKLDGSMIRPVIIDGMFRLGTKMGITDVSKMAEDYVVSNLDIPYREFCEHMFAAGLTPIFEFHCKKNVVVIDYEEPFMKLLAVRDNTTGVYVRREPMEDMSSVYGIPMVDFVEVDLTNPDEFLKTTFGEIDSEGYIVRFHDTGQTLKVKNDWYFQLHHVVSGLNVERNLVHLLINNDIDDVIPRLPENRRIQVEEYAVKFWDIYSKFYDKCDDVWQSILKDVPVDGTRKDFALRILKEDKPLQSIMFKYLEITDTNERHALIKKLILGNTNKENKFEEFMKWFNTQ